LKFMQKIFQALYKILKAGETCQRLLFLALTTTTLG
jgi:hypothetical protein